MRATFSLTALLLTSCALAQAVPSMEGQVVYQVMPDRFFDGDASNNSGVDRSNLRAWHGGDLAGLTQKLAYIQDLGATAVWLTPIYRQQAKSSFDTSAYHGYWPEDFRNVDPHFGSLATFDTFTKTARNAGMKVILDQVINHVGYEASTVTQHPAWFHTPAQCDAAADKDTVCPLSGLPDLNQQLPEVRQMLLGNADFWRARGVDAFRYDAIKHVDQAFLKELLARDRAAGTWTLGEWYDADTSTVAQWQKTGFDSLFLFSLQNALKRSIMNGQSLRGVAEVLSRSSELPRPGEVALFLDNHDVPRFAQATLFEDEAPPLTRYGLRALMTLRGIPVIWQGTEIAMRGSTDPDNRRDMRFENQWNASEKMVFGATKVAIAARKASPALSQGEQKLLAVPAVYADDLLLLTRAGAGQTVLAAWHNGKARRTFSLPLKNMGLSAADLAVTRSLFSDQDAKVSISRGYLHLSLPPKDAAAFPLHQEK
ncbi:alpha-amylase family glycosyl hydrolase [Deinococcus fonticola]|uniref:alpha-amylase family glycosyl hydrolase n=1 Tax=Deinococcus fonticola TaxID=2528713 RepID=UPI00107514C2|nr:alpha-amylase family glycosyl hydrolase [Deinococcus fonticola]